MIDFNSTPSGPFLRLVQPPPFDDLPEYVKNLNDRQREAVLITEGPLIVLAGAGSGKTKMLTSRIAYLIDALKVPAHHIMAVTFTNKAAAEMRERISRHLEHSSHFGSPEIGTFHAVCVRLLRREMPSTPYTQAFTIYDDSDQLSLIKGVVSKLGIDEKNFSPKSFQAAINRSKCDAIEPHEMEPAQHNFFDKQLKRVYEQYQKDLFANNAIDFGEILTMTYRLLRDKSDVRLRYQKRFRYIHVDEYQDTNRAQYLLLSQLAGATCGGHQNICVVGDEDQSIYKWRGADIHNILDFEKDYPGAKVVKLEQNYRSTQTIITAASQVISNNRERKDKKLWTENEVGMPILRFQLPDERAEAEMVVGEIKRLASHEERSYKDFSIFYRTHAQSRQFEDVFRREKIPYQIVGGLRFYDRKEIKDILSYFKVISNPTDSVSLKRIINVPARGIGKTTLDKLDALQITLENEAFETPTLEGVAGSASASWWDALQKESFLPSVTSGGTAKKLSGFVQFIQKLRSESSRLTVSELYHLILDETGYVRELRKEATEESFARIENLEEFDTLLQEFEEDFFEQIPEEERAVRKADLLPTFLEQSSLSSEVDSKNKEIAVSAVNMMTLHSSKGLEYPVVFLPGMEEGLFPSVRAWEEVSDADIEEERRLCYVGMTRAREILYLSSVVVRRIWGNVTYQEPARFFAEMPPELIEFRDHSQGVPGAKYRVGSSRQFGGGGDGGWGASRASDDDFSQLGPEEARIGGKSQGFSAVGDAKVGQAIAHPDYGAGKVVSSEGTGEEQKVVIDFGGRDRRKFLVRYIRQYLA